MCCKLQHFFCTVFYCRRRQSMPLHWAWNKSNQHNVPTGEHSWQCSWHFGVDPDPDPRIHASWLMDPDPAIFVIGLQDANTKLIFKKFFCLLLFEGTTFTSFFKNKKSKRSHKTVGIKFCLLFLLADRRIRIREAQKDVDPDTDSNSDQEHWFLALNFYLYSSVKVQFLIRQLGRI